MLYFVASNVWSIFYGTLTIVGILLAIRSRHLCIQKLMAFLFLTWVGSNIITEVGLVTGQTILYPIMDLIAATYTSVLLYQFRCACAKVILFIFLIMGLTHLVYNFSSLNTTVNDYVYHLILNILYLGQLGAIYVGSINRRALADISFFNIFGSSDHSSSVS